MADVKGCVCDMCDTFVRRPIDAPTDWTPPGWLIVILPGTERDVREQDKRRHICSGVCLELFAIERREAEEATVTRRAA